MNKQKQIKNHRTEIFIWAFDFTLSIILLCLVIDPFFEGIFLGFALSSLCMLLPTIYFYYKLTTAVRRGK